MHTLVSLQVLALSAGDRLRRRLARDDGQSTAEYALVLLGAAGVALLLVAWATKSDKVTGSSTRSSTGSCPGVVTVAAVGSPAAASRPVDGRAGPAAPRGGPAPAGRAPGRVARRATWCSSPTRRGRPPGPPPSTLTRGPPGGRPSPRAACRPTGCRSRSPGATAPGSRVRVEVAYRAPTSVPIVGRLLGDRTLRATVTMRVEGPERQVASDAGWHKPIRTGTTRKQVDDFPRTSLRRGRIRLHHGEEADLKEGWHQRGATAEELRAVAFSRTPSTNRHTTTRDKVP